VQYLFVVLSENGFSGSPDKVKAVKQYSKPKSVRDVRAFMGLASLYRRLVTKFVELSKYLNMLHRKDHEFSCGLSQEDAFDSMKDKLSITPELVLPNFKLPFILTTDTSKIALQNWC